MINFNRVPCIYWTDKMKISYVQRRIIIHSIIYYVLNESVISDKDFDSLCRQLIGFRKKFPKDYKESEYYYVFHNFDGNTGFDLYDNLIPFDKEYLTKIAYNVLNNYKGSVVINGN